MEGRNRNILVVLIAIVIVVAMLSSFGLNLFTGGTTPVVLPTASPASGPEDGSGESEQGGGPVRVEVTPDTVQNVIATLTRPESYYRVITVQDFWGEDSQSHTVAKVWVDEGWTKVEATNASGVVRTSLVGDGQVKIHYSSGGGELTVPADSYSDDLEGQRIPTYEDVLEVDQRQITDTGYQARAGQPCIYVEVTDDALGYREKYWVSTETGLLVAAETWDGEELIYSMTSDLLERPCPAGVLPPKD